MNASKIRAPAQSPEAKREAIFSMLQTRPLCKISRSYALFIPNLWLRLYGWEVDGRMWVRVTSAMDTIIIKPVDKAEAMSMMEVNDVAIKVS